MSNGITYVTDNLSLDKTLAAGLFSQKAFPHGILSEIRFFITSLGSSLSAERFERYSEDIWIAKSATIDSSAKIIGPCIIDERAEIRHSAFIRGSAIIGKEAVIGNSTEVKNALIFDGAHIPHFNYVGDSILGYRAHLGAGAITSNVKSDKSRVFVDYGNGRLDSGLYKLGAILGDGVEVGCNSVLNPGTVICRYSTVYPLSSVRGYLPTQVIYKGDSVTVPKKTTVR